MKEPKVGTRVRVMDADMSKELGYGTYLGRMQVRGWAAVTPRILLDTGVEIYGLQCWWTEAPDAPEVEPFAATLARDVRTFEPIFRNILGSTGNLLPAGERVEVKRIGVVLYDHRPQVAAQVDIDNEELYLIVTEMGLPQYHDGSPARSTAMH